MYKKFLLNTDLTPSQAEILDYLYRNKEAKASVIAKKIKRSRAIVYKELEELLEFGLVSKTEKPKQVALFSARHPNRLKKIMEKKEARLEREKKILDSALPDMISGFNLVNNRPGIRFFEGSHGMKKIYDEILAEGHDVYLVRAAYDPVFKEDILPIVEDFIAKRVRKGMKVKALTPRDIPNVNPEMDKKLLVDRTWVKQDMYTSPVEVDVFGNKVAILSFSEELIGFIIESKQIAQCLKQLFMLARLGAGASDDRKQVPQGRFA